MQKLRLHYDGPDKRKARVSEAESDIEKAHYSRERSFPFEKYVTKCQNPGVEDWHAEHRITLLLLPHRNISYRTCPLFDSCGKTW
jgi:hypothetical protein